METSRRTWPWVVAIGGLTLALLVTLWLLFTNTREDSTAATPDPTPTGGTEPAQYESACGLSGGPTEEPTEAPSEVSWVRIDGWPHPVSETSGPGERDESGAWTCFARTPLGSVLAVQNISLRLVLADDYAAVVDQQVSPGVGQEALRRNGQEANPGGITEPKGFHIDEWSPDSATITLWTAQDGQNYACTATVQWVDDDWKIQADGRGWTSTGCTQGIPEDHVQWGDY